MAGAIGLEKASAVAVVLAAITASAAGAQRFLPQQPTNCVANGGSLRGDVDGDGSTDRVSVRSCTFVVRSKAQTYTRSLASYGGPRLPRIDALVRLDASRRLDIAVDLVEGASSGFVGVFTVQRGRLVRMVVAGQGPALFAYAGSVQHLQGVDCARAGGIVLGFAGRIPGGYSVERRFLRVIGTTFREQPARTRLVHVRGGHLDERRFPEFAGVPFPHCPGVRR